VNSMPLRRSCRLAVYVVEKTVTDVAHEVEPSKLPSKSDPPRMELHGRAQRPSTHRVHVYLCIQCIVCVLGHCRMTCSIYQFMSSSEPKSLRHAIQFSIARNPGSATTTATILGKTAEESNV
jgi:hypothetical protein